MNFFRKIFEFEKWVWTPSESGASGGMIAAIHVIVLVLVFCGLFLPLFY